MTASYDTSSMLYDINLLPDKKRVVDFWPHLSAYSEFKNIVNDNEIKIAFLISDRNSPFIKIKDHAIKFKAIFEYLGINYSTGDNKELFEDASNYKHPRIINCCCCYLQLINIHQYSLWWNNNVLYYVLMTEMAAPMDKNDSLDQYFSRKIKVQDKAKQLLKELEEQESIIFGDTKLKQAVAAAELNKKRTYPEMFAEENSGWSA